MTKIGAEQTRTERTMTDNPEIDMWRKKVIAVEKKIKLMDDEALSYIIDFVIKEIGRRSVRYEIEHTRNRQRTRR